MTFWQAYLFCVSGIVLSVIIPILRAGLPKPGKGGTAGISGAFAAMAKVAGPYIKLGLFSLAVGVLLIAFAGNSLTDWRLALLLGYSWDSTLQKLK